MKQVRMNPEGVPYLRQECQPLYGYGLMFFMKQVRMNPEGVPYLRQGCQPLYNDCNKRNPEGVTQT